MIEPSMLIRNRSRDDCKDASRLFGLVESNQMNAPPEASRGQASRPSSTGAAGTPNSE